MRLVNLKFSRRGEVVREVNFKSGLNLILDAPVNSGTSSGNNVGKTTVLRLIDFCLGANGQDIWEDPEFKKINQEVFEYLHATADAKVILTLESNSGAEYKFERTFVPKRAKVPAAYVINEEVFSGVKAYQARAKEILFGSAGEKPSLRQLIPKFVRSSSRQLERTLKFLTPFTKDVEYESIHLFLFGFFDVEVLDQRAPLDQLLKKKQRDLEALTRDRDEGQIEQLLFHLREEVASIEKSFEVPSEVPELTARAAEVAAIRTKASSAAEELSEIDAEVASLRAAITDYRRDFGVVDAKLVRRLYDEALVYLPEIQDKFESLSEFVQKLRSRKERFLTSQLMYLDERRRELLVSLEDFAAEEKLALEGAVRSPEFVKALEVRSDLLDKVKRLGSLEQDLKDIQDLKSEITGVQRKIDVAKNKIDQGMEGLKQSLRIFNRYFSNYSERLYGEQYLLHTEINKEEVMQFKLAAVGANVGTGKKMSQTAAFDLAYADFVNEKRIPFPQFVCHDGLEAIHDNQLEALLEAANSFSGQMVISTLRGKLPKASSGLIEDNTVLELSDEDRFFRF